MNSRKAYVRCSIPNCANPVSYHNVKANKRGDGFRIIWKSMCNKHRSPGIGRVLADRWKLQQGCANDTGKYGFACTSVITDPGQLQINHIDGNNLNRDEKNIEVLCGNCHVLATKKHKHHLPNTTTRRTKLANPKLFKGL